MAMIVGNVVIDDSGAATTKTGLAGSIYDALLALPTYLTPASDAVSSVAGKRAQAALARALATGIVVYLQSNAQAKIVSGIAGDGLQMVDGFDTDRPAVDRFLSIV